MHDRIARGLERSKLTNTRIASGTSRGQGRATSHIVNWISGGKLPNTVKEEGLGSAMVVGSWRMEDRFADSKPRKMSIGVCRQAVDDVGEVVLETRAGK